MTHLMILIIVTMVIKPRPYNLKGGIPQPLFNGGGRVLP